MERPPKIALLAERRAVAERWIGTAGVAVAAG
jgi:hypothetical protein